MSKLGFIIKNYLKLMLRSRVLIVVIILGTLFVVGVLSNAFQSLLNEAEEAGEFTLSYQMSEDSSYLSLESMLVAQLEDTGITCRKYAGKNPETMIRTGEACVFLDFTGEDYHIYGDAKNEIQVRSIQYAMFMVEENLKAVMNPQNQGLQQGVRDIKTQVLPYTKTATAQDYYSIIEIVYFLSLCVIFLTLILQEERGNHIISRFRASTASSTTLYFGKLLPCVIMAIVVQVIVTGGLVTILFHLNWGQPVYTFLVLCLTTVAFATFGLVFLLLFKNMAVSIGCTFMIIWIMGFVGGSFETYMYTSVPRWIQEISPIYYVNRTLVEFSTMGESASLVPCILYLTAMIVVSVPIGILLCAKRKES